MSFPGPTYRESVSDFMRRIPKPALVGAAALLVFALAGVAAGFGSCAPDPAFTLSAQTDAQDESAAEERPADGSGEKEDEGVAAADSEGKREGADGEDDSGADASGAEAGAKVSSANSASAEMAVYVSGAVASPGVYTLAMGSRACDAVNAAGGFSADAAQDAVNLARKLTDGEQLAIPTQDQAVSEAVGGTAAATEPAAGNGGASSSQAVSGASSPQGPVNINTAGLEELDSLAGVGPATAQAIIDEREANGPFSSIEDIQRVSGIGEKKFEKLKADICVQ